MASSTCLIIICQSCSKLFPNHIIIICLYLCVFRRVYFSSKYLRINILFVPLSIDFTIISKLTNSIFEWFLSQIILRTLPPLTNRSQLFPLGANLQYYCPIKVSYHPWARVSPLVVFSSPWNPKLPQWYDYNSSYWT